MFFALQILENLLYLASMLYIAERLLLLKRKRITGSLLWAAVGWLAVNMGFGILETDPFASMAGLLALTVLLVQLFYQGTRIRLLLYDFFAFFFLAMIDEIAMLLFRLVSGHLHFSLSFDHDSLITNLITSVFAFISLVFISNLFWKRYSGYIREITILQLALMTAVISADEVTIVALFFIRDQSETFSARLDIVILLLVAGLYLQLGLLIPMIASIDIYRQKAELSQRYLNEQISHYRYLEEQNRDIRKFRHDMKNHMAALETLYREGRTREFEDYLEEINGRITGFGTKIHLNNGIAEAIVSKYLREADERQIRLIVSGKLPEECSLTGMEICTILSNLLSNAMEAVVFCGGREILLTLRYEKDEIYIRVENDCISSLNFSGEQITTGKEDKNSHGFGVENIRECVRKHDGWLHMEAGGGRFLTCIELKNTGGGKP